MTEGEWQNAQTASGLIDHFGFHRVCRAPDRRRLRLLAIACARRMLPVLPADPAFAGIIDAAELYADNYSLRSAAVAARKPLRQAARNQGAARARQTLGSAVNVLIDLTNDAIEGFTAGIANAGSFISKRNAAGPTEHRIQADLLRDIFGNPFHTVKFDPAWRTSTAIALTKGMYESRDFGAMPILADALQDAGCDNEEVLNHCRGPGPHVRGCWVVDRVLGKE